MTLSCLPHYLQEIIIIFSTPILQGILPLFCRKDNRTEQESQEIFLRFSRTILRQDRYAARKYTPYTRRNRAAVKPTFVEMCMFINSSTVSIAFLMNTAEKMAATASGVRKKNAVCFRRVLLICPGDAPSF